MTWNEFKELVDRELAERGKDGMTLIWYIDISIPKDSRLFIGTSESDGSLFINNLRCREYSEGFLKGFGG